MRRLRPFAAQDAAQVAALHERAFPEARWASPAARAAYFREVLLRHPWVDPELPSWVAEEAGRIVGFFGVMPRRMLFGGRAIRVAVGCQFMVDPERRGLAALELMRKFLCGPQALSVADGANESSRRLWEAAGGIASPLHAQHWLRLLRPARSLLRRRMPALAPLGALADACLARLAPLRPDHALREEPLDPAVLLEMLRQERASLRPDYDLASLEWLLGELEAKTRHGRLERCLLREPDGRVAGWFLYYLNGDVSQVAQIGARPERRGAVLERLFAHAAARGALALEGRMEARLAPALGAAKCLLQDRGIAMLLHARDPALALAFLRGDAFFSRLEGEWWMRFLGPDATGTPTPRAERAARWQAPGRRSPAAAR